MQFNGLNGWFEIFKAGTHTDSMGNKRIWTGEDLLVIESSYDPLNHEAPLVIGHPEINAPAYGWVEALKLYGDTLFAKAKDVVKEFEDMVKQGLFKKRSISLYPDLQLRHIGFLGATPPAIKGLRDIKFGCVTNIAFYELSEDNLHDPGGRLDLLIAEFMEQPGKHDQYGRKITHKVTYGEALTIVAIQNPEINQEYINTLKRRK